MSPDPFAVTAVVGTIGSLSAIAKGLLEKALGPSADLIGSELRSRLEQRLATNRMVVLNRAALLVEESGKEMREIPIRIAAGILAGAALEENAEMQERWAALLASAATADPSEIPPVFAAILSNLTPASAQTLDALRHTRPLRGVGDQPDGLSESGAMDADRLQLVLNGGNQATDAAEWYSRLQRINELVDILVREGLASKATVIAETGAINRGGPSAVKLGGVEMRITHLGLQFLRALDGPSR